MRITKSMLKKAVAQVRERLSEITAIAETGGLRQELEQVVPAWKDMPDRSDARMIRVLVWEALDKAIPSCWYE